MLLTRLLRHHMYRLARAGLVLGLCTMALARAEHARRNPGSHDEHYDNMFGSFCSKQYWIDKSKN